MLNTAGDILNAVIVRGNISTTSAYYTDSILRAYVNDAYKWAAAAHKWPFTEGRITTTYSSSVEEYNYPEGWRSDSVRLLQIGGKRLEKLNFEDYQIFREETPDADDRVFSDLGRVYFVNPKIDLSGTITAFGQYTPASLDLTDSTTSAGTTVFSNSEEEGNEAIVYEALSYLKGQEKKSLNETQYLHQRAVEILEGIWKRYLDEQYQYKTHATRDGMFKRIDVINGGLKDELFNRDQF